MTDEPQPLTDEELDEIASETKTQLAHVYDVMFDNTTLEKVLRLVAEVRSLRANEDRVMAWIRDRARPGDCEYGCGMRRGLSDHHDLCPGRDGKA